MALFAGVALAGPKPAVGTKPPTAHHKTAAKAPAKAKLVCPVTGIKLASASKALAKSTYKGKTYYFCCPACKPKFDKNPAKYIRNSAKGVYETM
ncbi:MAG: YHS domain-containing protein [Armatimonadetes bacterium]|nr:YHS domain-containing protein [Armatimonadota bacterium]